MNTHRRLVAILAADVAGYTRLVERDTDRTVAAWRTACTDIVDPSIAEHSGRVVKLTGDGFLAEFSTVQDAVNCAIVMQEMLALHPLDFRMGVHLGDIVDDGKDIHGEGVNIAARIEALAEPGGINVSAMVFEAVRHRVDAEFERMGEYEVKNVSSPVQVYRINQRSSASMRNGNARRPSEDKPTVAVLPFDNMSGDEEQSYFSDGLTEDIITALSKHRWLDVIARNTTFAYRGQSSDIRKLATELGADYVVEGSVRKSGRRIRVTAQLIDGQSGKHIWAQRYDRQLEDIFDLQDEITQTVVARIEPEIGVAIQRQLLRVPRRDLHAWEYFHLGLAKFNEFSAEGNIEAQELFKRSRELDPSFPEAHAWWAYAVILGMVYWDTAPEAKLMDEAFAATRQAVALDNQNAVLYMLMGRVQLARREYRSALSECETAVRLNPTLATAYCGLGDSLNYEGRYDEAIPFFEQAIGMSPSHPQLWAFLSYGALCHIFKGTFDRALDWTERAHELPNCQYWTTAHAVVALAHLDRLEEAGRMVERLQEEMPSFSIAYAKEKLFYLKRPEQLDIYIEGLEKAGVRSG